MPGYFFAQIIMEILILPASIILQSFMLVLSKWLTAVIRMAMGALVLLLVFHQKKAELVMTRREGQGCSVVSEILLGDIQSVDVARVRGSYYWAPPTASDVSLEASRVVRTGDFGTISKPPSTRPDQARSHQNQPLSGLTRITTFLTRNTGGGPSGSSTWPRKGSRDISTAAPREILSSQQRIQSCMA